MPRLLPLRPAVALLIETSNAYARGLLKGIVAYVRAHRAWSMSLPEVARGQPAADWLKHWRGDGIIARVENAAIAEEIRQTGLPAVDLSAGRFLPEVPCVETDNEAIVRVAVEEFLTRGFRSLAFCGERRFRWSQERGRYFRELARRWGYRPHTFFEPSSRRAAVPLPKQLQELREWALELPRPVGILACYDIRAQQLLEVCRTLGVAVPEEMAVLGVDNDELLCNLCTPPLSSVIPNTHRTGYEAAALLDRMLAGEKVPPEVHLIAPLGIQTRQSTDTLAIDNRDIASAVRFIREHACDGINVEDVLATVPLTRRGLESLFQKYLGRTPHEEIVRLKIERVKQLLSETELKMTEIARRSGFQHVEYMSTAFKRAAGVAPSLYRRRSQGKET